MEAITRMSGAPFDDSELVEAARDGNRDAYGQIVARYQSLICSLAYSGTGSVTRSEDIAQETFITGWKQLCELRDPANLRAWLCGIARNLISNAHRRSVREPAEIGEPLDPMREMASTESSPPEQAIRKEEEAILWRALGSIPENYREPLILYYREHRSVAQVAVELGLSEDATKQRLARGRAFLQEQVLAFIEGTLDRTKPGAEFTRTVMSVMPIIGSSATVVVGASTAKGSTVAKAGSTFGGAGFVAAILSFFGLLGGYVGWQMSDARSETERIWIARFWRHLVIGMATFLVPGLIASALWRRSHPWIGTAISFYLIGIYVFIGVPLAIWAWLNHQRRRGRSAGAGPASVSLKLLGAAAAFALIGAAGTVVFGFPSGAWTDLWLETVFALGVMTLAVCAWDWRQRHPGRRESSIDSARGLSKPVSLWWVALATICMAALLPLSIGGGWRTERVSAAAAREMIAAHPEARIHVSEYQNGTKLLGIEVMNANGKPTRYVARADAATLATLNQRSVAYKTQRQGRDFEIFGWPGKLLLLFSVFTVAAGVVVLARRLRNRRGQI